MTNKNLKAIKETLNTYDKISYQLTLWLIEKYEKFLEEGMRLSNENCNLKSRLEAGSGRIKLLETRIAELQRENSMLRYELDK